MAGWYDQMTARPPPSYGEVLTEPSLRAYEPTWRDRFSAWLIDSGVPEGTVEGLMGSRGLGPSNKRMGMGLVDFTPAGIPLAVNESQRAADAGDWTGATLNAMAVIPGAKAGQKAIEAGVNEVKQGIRAYHGSPHDFDKFDLSKIGTGEGYQMEGHGLYFGQSPDVGEFYHTSTVKDRLARKAKEAQPLHPEQQRKIVDQIADIIDSEGVDALDEYLPPRGFESAWDAAVADAKQIGGTKGHRYEVNINADMADFYDLNKPLNEQPPHVIDAFNRVARDPRFALNVRDDMRHADVLPLFKNPEAVKELNNLGVRGVKYWDQWSRKENDGTKNLVVFDDKIIDILRKYGIAGLTAGMGGAALMGGPSEAQAGER